MNDIPGDDALPEDDAPAFDHDLLESLDAGPEWGEAGDKAVPPRLPGCTNPVPVGGRLTSPFGKRGTGFHAGQDVAPPAPAQQGVTIHAIAAGTVDTAREKALKGHTGLGVVIRHPGGVASYYGHLASIRVAAGQAVAAGQVIGVMGFTGNTSPRGPGGTHLHLGILFGGQFIDPRAYLASNGVALGKASSGGAAGGAPAADTAAAPPGDVGERLRAAGYPTDGPEGLIGAVKAYQRTNGLLDDGDWGPVTERHYQFTRLLQSTLNGWKAVSPKLRVDGDFGPRTHTALRQMQERNGLAVTGEADAATRARLGI